MDNCQVIPHMKQCQDGSCVSDVLRCPEDPCPLEHAKCDGGGTCYSNQQACDGVFECTDEGDERGCGLLGFLNVNVYASPLLLTGMAVLFTFCALMTAYFCYQRRRRRLQDAQQPPHRPPPDPKPAVVTGLVA